jgi:hypothetical protein
VIEPVTLLAIMGTFNFATRVRPIVQVRDGDTEMNLPYTATEIPLLEGRSPSTFVAPLPTEQLVTSQLERTMVKLTQFSLAPACGNSQPANDALSFLAAIPQYLPAPKVAEDDTGMITLFWNTPSFYGDIEFRGDGRFSVFTRLRDGTGDRFLEDHPLHDAAGDWLYDYMRTLFPKLEQAA